MLADARHGLPLPHPDGIPNWLTAIERESGAFVGFAVLTVFGPAHVAAIWADHCPSGPVVEVGYRLAKCFWGRGYATEAASTLVRHGFEMMRLPLIAGIADERNAASKHVLEKLGLTRRKTYELKGVSIDFYSLSIEEYQVKSAGSSRSK
jgi:RimJ/RimL family protein N-acetyltransferase